MRVHRLPRRIALVMIGSILMSILTITVSVGWMGSELDRQSHDNNATLAENARRSLLMQMRVLLLDYAKWEAAVPRVLSSDMTWLHDNIGSTAITGPSMQVAVLWGGPFPRDFGWQAGGPNEATSGLVDPNLLDLVEKRLRRIPLNLYRGVEFFAWRDGRPFVMGAARFEADSPSEVARIVSYDSATPRLLLGRAITPDLLSRLGEDYLLPGLKLAQVVPEGGHSLPLLGVDGQPIGWLAWDSPHPGMTMLRRMMLPLLLVSLLASALVIAGMVLLRRNAEILVEAEQQASRSARTDALTGLPNRLAFKETLDQPARADERAILFLDVNGFKRINDSFGHAAGDRLIAMIATRLACLAGPGIRLARIAGDEFVFVATGAQVESRIQDLADGIRAALADGFDLLGHRIRASVAMGYAVQSSPDMSGDDLVRQADLAMYEAKRCKTARPVAFGAVLERSSRDAQDIEQGLRRAIVLGHEFSIAYQPIVGRDGRLVRAEALARWHDAAGEPVPPDRFIAVAERAGLIFDLGRALMDIVWDDLARYPDLCVSVNISSLQLLSPDFVPQLITAASDRGIDPSRLDVELTESVVVDDPLLAAEKLEALREAGFTTSLDDFGAGYSSIGALRSMAFGSVKIDRSFVSAAVGSPQDTAVLNGMIQVAHGLGLRVVAEGIEGEGELALLHRLGCDLAQGFHIGRPMPVDALARRWLPGREARADVA